MGTILKRNAAKKVKSDREDAERNELRKEVQDILDLMGSYEVIVSVHWDAGLQVLIIDSSTRNCYQMDGNLLTEDNLLSKIEQATIDINGIQRYEV